MPFLRRFLTPLGFITLIAVSGVCQASSIASDGGITLWLSYELDLDDEVTQDVSGLSASCTPTNNARAAQLGPGQDSPGSCGDGTALQTCTGREKLIGDLEKFADYLYEASEGAHYLRHVYISDQGRSWETADVKWQVNSGSSSVPVTSKWDTLGGLKIGTGKRTCIHEVLHHEIGHYLYRLPDRYSKAEAANYYKGTVDDADGNTSDVFKVGVCVGDPNTVMSSNFPHKYVDTTNASITVSYDPPPVGGADDINCPAGQVLTPALLADGNPNNDGPDRAHSIYDHPFAQDEWGYLPGQHIDLTDVHIEGDFSDPDFNNMPEPELHFIGADVLSPGIILLLDRSGSMNVQTNGVSAAQFVQEAGLYLYHSTPVGEFVGAYVYNAGVDPLFEYAEYDPTFALPGDPGQAPLNPTGATNIALALETAIDAFVAEHGNSGANGGQIFLMSDGKPTVGNDLFAQVDRASQLGIKIHTFTYGNADAAIMAQISSTTSGDETAMFEAESGSELKLGMAKQFSLLRGNTPVFSFKGKLTKTGVSGGQEYFQAVFQLPPTAQNLRFYAFQADGNASELDIHLKDSNGQSYPVASTQLTDKGRFAGTRIEAPQPGKWIARILADKKRKVLPEGKVEIVAYADDLSLDGRAWFKSGPNSMARKMQLRAFLNYQYPLTNMKVIAHLYRDGKRVASVRMYDDGENGGDNDQADGVYSAELDMQQLRRKLGFKWIKNRYGTQNPKMRIDVQYLVSKESVPAPNHHYETGTRYKDLLEDYRPAQFEAWTTQVQSFARKSPKPVLRQIKPRTVTPGRKYRARVTVLNARPQADQIRLSLGPGIQARVDRVRPRRGGLGVTLWVSYHVQRAALPGQRDLKIQFGDTLLVREGAVNIRVRKDRSVSVAPQVTPATKSSKGKTTKPSKVTDVAKFKKDSAPAVTDKAKQAKDVQPKGDKARSKTLLEMIPNILEGSVNEKFVEQAKFVDQFNPRLIAAIRPSMPGLPAECNQVFDIAQLFHDWSQVAHDARAPSRRNIIQQFAYLSKCLTVNELHQVENSIYGAIEILQFVYLLAQDKAALRTLYGDFLFQNLQPLLLLCDSSKNWGKRSLCFKLFNNNRSLLKSIGRDHEALPDELFLFDRMDNRLVGFPVCEFVEDERRQPNLNDEQQCVSLDTLVRSFNPGSIGLGDCSLPSMILAGSRTIRGEEMFTCPTDILCSESPQQSLEPMMRYKWGDEFSPSVNDVLSEINFGFCNQGGFKMPTRHGGFSGFMSRNGCGTVQFPAPHAAMQHTMACAGLSNDQMQVQGIQSRLPTSPSPVDGVSGFPGCDPRLMEPSDGNDKAPSGEELAKQPPPPPPESDLISKVIENIAKAAEYLGKEFDTPDPEMPEGMINPATAKDAPSFGVPGTQDIQLNWSEHIGLDDLSPRDILGTGVNVESVRVQADAEGGWFFGIGGTFHCPPDAGCGNGCTAIGAQVSEDPTCALGENIDPVIAARLGGEFPDPVDLVSMPNPDAAPRGDAGLGCNLGMSNRGNSICDAVMCPADAQRSSSTVNCCGIGAGPVGGLGGLRGMGQDACLHMQCQDGFVCQQGRCQPPGGGGEQPPGGGPGGLPPGSDF